MNELIGLRCRLEGKVQAKGTVNGKMGLLEDRTGELAALALLLLMGR